MTHPRLNITDDQLAGFCRKWKIVEVWLFGSVLRDDFTPRSDIDVMVRFEDAAPWSLFELAAMKLELEALTGRTVDLIEKPAVEHHRNPWTRHEILSTAERVYAA
jgi:predicted nucleotidyltransferase